MSTTWQLVCNRCGQVYDVADQPWRCSCGGVLDVADFPMTWDVQGGETSLWRYRSALPIAADSKAWRAVSMGEGMTPLVPLDSGTPNVLVKVDFLMPTLSFKDRGAAVLMTKALEMGVARVVADSSGNAGTAIAAYSARAGIACDIFVPEHTSVKKIKQIKAHGASVHLIPGSREDTAMAAQQMVEQTGAFYASHVYNPFFYQGTKTFAYEIWEQLGGQAPEVVVVPVGNGTLLLGAYYGFQDLLRWGMIEKMPRLLAVQAEPCAPLVAAFADGAEEVQPVVNQGTLAEGIAIADPARGRQILAAVWDTGGTLVTAPEQAIDSARRKLASKGLYVEQTAAATYAAFLNSVDAWLSGTMLAGQEAIFQEDPWCAINQEKVVIALTGAGLKGD